MGYMMQGTVYIPTEEFWSFVQNYYEHAFNQDSDGVYFSEDMYFEDEELFVPFSNTHGGLYIGGAEFWEFVMKYTPCNVAEYSFGKPRITCGDVVINFAANTECHPSDQAEKPNCIKEWQ